MYVVHEIGAFVKELDGQTMQWVCGANRDYNLAGENINSQKEREYLCALTCVHMTAVAGGVGHQVSSTPACDP